MIQSFIHKITTGENLLENEMMVCMEKMMSGKVDDIQIAGFLTALKTKGESIEEITGAARVLRKKAAAMNLEEDFVIDTCGTGGDGAGTYNISTAAALIAAAAGVKVAKHGNRSISSQCGSADVLEALGVKINLTKEQARQCLKETNLCFLFAPQYHSAMKHVANVRKKLGIRTLFNILGPLANPALAKGQVLGVFHPDLTRIMAEVLNNVGVRKAMVVYGYDGLDELTVTASSRVTELDQGRMKTYTIEPEQYGFKRAEAGELKGGTASENATIIRNIFNGEKGAKTDILLFNAGAALYISDKAQNIQEGIQIAQSLIDSGEAMKKLEQWIQVTKRLSCKTA